MKVTPQPLADYSVSNAPGTALSYFGYEFEVPWNASSKVKAFGKNGIVQLGFESGQSVTLIVPENQNGLLTELAQDKSLNMKNLQLLLGDLMKLSAYDQCAALLNATPQSIRAFGPRARAVRGATLLTIRSIAFNSSQETGVFSFEFPDKRGFQIGDPRKSRRVDLEVFGMADRHVEILLTNTKDSVWLSQPEINRILTSLHAVAGKPGTLPSVDRSALPN